MAAPNFPGFIALPELGDEPFYEDEMMPPNPTPTELENAPVDNASVHNEEPGERSIGKRPRTSLAWQHFTEESRPNPKTGEMEIRAMMPRSKNSSRQPFAHNLNGTFNATVSCTSDLWEGCNKTGYLCVTAHYVDDDWVLQ
ncbi:hypothetical protein L484_003910 [Morus notabilis]|uniref:Uncharacterized protein n=1 Tax=Morus notabilis TaxID=981085 RepID=W9RMX1_9ROSA|nr:hypothetical protein L484_003910 [Morus notabilis]